MLLAPDEVATLTIKIPLPDNLPAGAYRGALLLQGFREGAIAVAIAVTPPPAPKPSGVSPRSSTTKKATKKATKKSAKREATKARREPGASRRRK
jgi:hypothetical protein